MAAARKVLAAERRCIFEPEESLDRSERKKKRGNWLVGLKLLLQVYALLDLALVIAN
jgi:hypothetical protein